MLTIPVYDDVETYGQFPTKTKFFPRPTSRLEPFILLYWKARCAYMRRICIMNASVRVIIEVTQPGNLLRMYFPAVICFHSFD
ncbi:hypothetical protein CHS0354_018218 [Potamilus streckersoni]|uniref:Uncharacterized protein n=1 Tax=Potamilus streckersoni TaxID=2493646 RepID=A0AAE0VJD2_9BIVA|nr:hypothetical protein CHS0354_018218 [Potamilus streckersoni]